MATTQASPQAIPLNARTLRDWPLPALDGEGDKEARGRVVVIAGSREIPGAAILAATAALRAGAGKLVVATGASTALHTAFALPEARVIALPETSCGGVDTAAAALLAPVLQGAHAVLVGPGMQDDTATQRLVAALLPLLGTAPLLLDALAMNLLAGAHRMEVPALLTPHAGEMAHLTGASKESILADPAGTVLAASARWNCVVALKGASTWIATPQGRLWHHEEANCGLATSGSGDVLAGTMAGLAARGAPPAQACAWGVVLHAHAGARLAARYGEVGFLARELPGELPAALQALQAPALRTADRPSGTSG